MVLKYNDYDVEAAQAELDESEQGGANFFKVKAGKNYMRILPPPAGQRSPFRVTYQHYLNMPGAQGKTQSVICARLEAKQACLVCQKVDELRASQAKADQDAASDLFARRRVFCNVIDRNDEEHGPKIYAFGKTVHEQLLALRTDSKGGGNYVDPIDGFDIIIERKGTGKNDTEYTVRGDRNSSPLGPADDVMQEWIDTQHNLNLLAKLPESDKVAGYLGGGDDEEAEAPAPARRGAPAARGAARGGAPQVGARVAQAAVARRGDRAPARRTAEDDAIDVEGEAVAD